MLIGDAAHTCPPTIAQGGAKALEDAVVLAELLTDRDTLDRDLWDAFTARRFERAQTVVDVMHPRMGEMMSFMRISAWHHRMAIARGPHPSLHHASFEMRGIDEYMRGTDRLLRAGVEKIWGLSRHLAGNDTFSYFLDPHGNTVEYTTELELVDEDTWHPHMYDFSNPEVSDPDKGLFVAPPV